jgi:hypothetical protein
MSDELSELEAALAAVPDLTVEANRSAVFDAAAMAYWRGRALHQPALEEMAKYVIVLCGTVDEMSKREAA